MTINRKRGMKSKGRILAFGSLLVVTGLLLTSCASFAETPGERFRKAMKEIEANCSKRKLERNEVCGAITKLKPADPLSTPEGRFAHSIEIPNPVPKDSGYRPGMSPEEYFEHLCRTEAGEFVFRIVENVDGILLMRPRKQDAYEMQRHLYAIEDPFGFLLEPRTPQNYFVQPPIGKYEFIELKDQEASNSMRFYRDPQANTGKTISTWIEGRHVRIPYIIAMEKAETLKSQYGYVWRGIERSNDRELGIAGGELIVLDVRTTHVLALRRGFIRGDLHPSGIGFEWKQGCPNVPKVMTQEFIMQVLKPRPSSF